MLCRFCRKPINPIRRLWDQEFCCRAHRFVFERAKFTEEVIYSARLLRQMEQSEEDLVFLDEADEKKKQRNLPLPLILCIMFGFVLLLVTVPSSNSAPASRAVDYALDRSSDWFPALRKFRVSLPSVTLRESFHAGLKNWQPADLKSHTGAAGDWIYRAGSVRPGRLRLWAPSLQLTDYNFGFDAQIERRGLGWAFRAANHQNYYGARVEIIKPGAEPVSNIVHYTMVRGRQLDRVELPLPLGIGRGEQYQISMSIRGSKFITSINGQVVDTWTDQRLRAGGVGFFTQKGDLASISSVSVTTERSLWDRLFSSFILLPPVSMISD